MSAVMEARSRYKDLFEKKHGIRLGFMGFFVKAACLALKDIPSVNGSIAGDEIVYRDYIDASIPVPAPNGLVPPMPRAAQALSFAATPKTLAHFANTHKQTTLPPTPLSGHTSPTPPRSPPAP